MATLKMGSTTVLTDTTLANAVQDNITRLGTVTSGNLSNTAIVYPAGHVVRTTSISSDVSGHINTNLSSHVATGLIVSTPATTGSNYNIITWSGNSYTYANAANDTYLYSSKNEAPYAQTTGGDTSGRMHFYYNSHRRLNMTWIDNSSGLTAGTNLYQIYMKSDGSAQFYFVHSGYDYQFIVQEIQV